MIYNAISFLFTSASDCIFGQRTGQGGGWGYATDGDVPGRRRETATPGALVSARYGEGVILNDQQLISFKSNIYRTLAAKALSCWLCVCTRLQFFLQTPKAIVVITKCLCLLLGPNTNATTYIGHNLDSIHSNGTISRLNTLQLTIDRNMYKGSLICDASIQYFYQVQQTVILDVNRMWLNKKKNNWWHFTAKCACFSLILIDLFCKFQLLPWLQNLKAFLVYLMTGKRDRSCVIATEADPQQIFTGYLMVHG